MQTFWDNVLRVVAVIGLLAVLLLGAWGIIQIAFLLPSFFGNLFSGHYATPAASSETVSVSVPVAVAAQQPFNLTWSHTNKSGEYSYAVSYSCEQGFAVAAPVPTGSYTQVPCNTPFNYINASSSMPLVGIFATSTRSAHPTFTVTATKLSTGAVTAHGSAATTVTASAVASKPTTTTKTPTKSTSGGTYYASGRTSNLYGYSDLAVSMNSAYSQGGNTTAVFTIQNIGTNVSPSNWTFNATLPVNGSYVYPSGPQQALYPGDKIVYTLHYSESNTGGTPCTGYGFPCTPPITYGGPSSCNQYGPCTIPGYSNYTIVPNQYSYSYSGSSYGNPEVVSIQVDPFGLFPEVSKANNYASQTYIAH